MGIEKEGSKRGKNIGGFLQLFDWNAKSRKKLFPEKSKQKKRCDGNLPVTRVQLLDEDEYITGPSIKGCSDYSCTSSVTDEDFHGTKAPGVVARLMGLDSLPRSNSCEPNSTPLFDCRSLPGSCYQSENLEYHRDYMHSSSLQDVPFRTEAEPKYQKVIHRPLEKFQTEILPPKSAKAIPVTRNRLLSPIKSANAIPPENAAHIMEAAARIINPGPPPASVKTKLPPVGSSLVPLKVRDFKENVQSTQKPAKISEDSQRSSDSSTAKELRGQPINKSWNSPGDAASLRIFHDSEESSSVVKSKGKSISLALQAKANVQRREGLNLNGIRAVASLKETSEISPNQQPLKSRPLEHKSMLKKPSAQNDSSVLRQNNQKQNSTVDREKQPSKPKLQGGKVQNGDSTTIRQRNSSKLVGTSKVSSRNSGSDVKDDKRQVLPSSSDRATSKKRSIDGNCNTEKNRAADSIRKDKNGKVTRSRNTMDSPSSWIQETGRMGTDVISFTFTAPITRSGPGSGRYNEAGEKCKVMSSDFQNNRMPMNSHGLSDPNFPVLGNRAEGKDTLSTLLEQKLKELALTVELSKQKSETGSNGTVPDQNPSMSSSMEEDNKCRSGNYADSIEGQLDSSLYSFRDSKLFITDQKCQNVMNENGILVTNPSDGKILLHYQLPGPLSVLDHSPFASSCSSSDTAESNTLTRGGKQCSLMQLQDILSGHSTNKPTPLERDAELSDSASSTSAETEASSSSNGKAINEMEYVKEIVQNIEVMYDKYASGRASKIISPHLFNQLETRKRQVNNSGLVCKINRKLMFDCVSEWMELRCREYAGGGYELWVKGLGVVKRKDKLIKDVYKEICGWSDMGDFMVDELVDSDMSSQYGRWLDFELEAFELGTHIQSRILNSLIDEVVADILVL